jgi:hypothetical protein
MSRTLCDNHIHETRSDSKHDCVNATQFIVLVNYEKRNKRQSAHCFCEACLTRFLAAHSFNDDIEIRKVE